MQIAKDKSYSWQKDWGTLSLSLPLADIKRLEFLSEVTGVTRSKMARGLVRKWIDTTIGVKASVPQLRAEWEKLTSTEQRAKRNHLRNAFYEAVKCEDEGEVTA